MNIYEDLFKVHSYDPAVPSMSQTRPDPVFDKAAWKLQKQEEKRRVFLMIEETIAKMPADGYLFRNMLEIMARFENRSLNNQILILAQLPSATKLADFKGWKEGTHIRKGEKGILMLASRPAKGRSDGARKFVIQRVFDISQTNLLEKEKDIHTLDVNILYRALFGKYPYPVIEDQELPKDVEGEYRPDEKVIALKDRKNVEEAFRCLVRAIVFDKMEIGSRDYDRRAFTAYCVSFVVCKRFGVDVTPFRFESLPLHLEAMYPIEFRKELLDIRSSANSISNALDEALNAVLSPEEPQI